MNSIAMMFAGQGSQSVGMGKSFYDNSDIAKEMFEKASNRLDIDFTSLLFEKNDKLDQTEFTQPAILLVQMVAYRLFKERFTNKASCFLGHSLGEFSAVCAAGGFDYLDALELVHKRGALMQKACESIEASMMAVVGLDDESVERVCNSALNDGKKVWPANYNQDGQLVVAGLKSDLESISSSLKEAGAKRALLLNMSVASHCELLKSAKAPLKELIESMLHESFEAPIISNVTAKKYMTKSDAIELLVEQLVSPVRYKQSVQAISSSVDLAIEFGNGSVLKGLNRRIAKDLKTINISDMNTLEEALSQLS